MKLYYKAGACSLASHIALSEAGVPFETESVDLATKVTATGADFTKVNPKGYVPALLLDDGTVLTEGVAIMQYVADLRPATGIAPANGTMERYRLQEWLHYIGSEVHKSFGPLFGPFPEEAKTALKERIRKRLGELDKHLAGRQWLLDRFSVEVRRHRPVALSQRDGLPGARRGASQGAGHAQGRGPAGLMRTRPGAVRRARPASGGDRDLASPRDALDCGV